ncbi:adenosylcobinamide-GDP ribazoletransferase [Paraburkholderia sp. Ac-20336]|uniref:adenosylcobinamide-GDP ribazoletransferase n=1 Tax=Burkholderiaceae TaxID=119060 RepID=UPI00141DB84A|nr:MULTISPECIES: adenosylcobinamide-GDP ribazoletransferase [Burkholderiaceae]MBN3807274.1 adenosylcobinamide-GDP ribazoletransferase [Paraburkholderia sp. Ac-20336]MBN3845370.1 adenosylcobinamide-GDP ribazoletransferase [Paraburkholderia sp. Ac-20342]NIF50800.1 adenosylcobinamide-GDP ribazoletransferase [Burkholderia sp. Ax-1724]
MNPLAELRYFFTALGYFTRVPVPRWVGYEPHYLNAAARYFPLVGVLIGGLSALVYLAALRVFPAGVAVLLSMAASLLVTGAFHEDGLADCVDAFGGAYSREDVLRIMHDSRVGAFGAIALVVALALKWQTLAALPPSRAAGLMIAAHGASRAMAISYLATLDYVRAEGKAKPVAQRLSGPALMCAALFGLPWLLWPNGRGAPDWRFALATCCVLLVLRVAIGRYFVRRIGGYTGDCLGFAQQVFELSIYLVGLAWISS